MGQTSTSRWKLSRGEFGKNQILQEYIVPYIKEQNKWQNVQKNMVLSNTCEFNIFYCMVLITKIFNTTLHSFNRWIMVVRMFRKHNLLFLIQLIIKFHLNSSKRNFKMIITEYVLSFRREFFKFLFLIITKRQFYLFLFIMHVYRLSWILKCLFSIC